MAAPAAPEPPDVARPPAYAWDWLQRSRPVVARLAQVLTGRPPGPGFVQAVRRSFDDDPLVRDAVFGVIAEVAFRGRVPRSRPHAASWDRGLVWWAAAVVGLDPAGYETDRGTVDQPALFDTPPRPPLPSERRALVAALRELLAQRTGDQVPAAVVRQLIAQLEESSPDDDPVG